MQFAKFTITQATDSRRSILPTLSKGHVIYILPFRLTLRNIRLQFPQEKELSTAKCPKSHVSETLIYKNTKRLSMVWETTEMINDLLKEATAKFHCIVASAFVASIFLYLYCELSYYFLIQQ